MFWASSAHPQEVSVVKLYMYAASGILILCRWPSCALAKGRLQVGINKGIISICNWLTKYMEYSLWKDNSSLDSRETSAFYRIKF